MIHVCNEKRINFEPVENWKPGNYQIIIDSRIEDIAGNNLQNLLDHFQTDEENNSNSFYYMNFSI